MVERYQLFADPFGKGIIVTVRVEDPGAFTMPWTGTAEHRQNTGVISSRKWCARKTTQAPPTAPTFGTIPEEKDRRFDAASMRVRDRWARYGAARAKRAGAPLRGGIGERPHAASAVSTRPLVSGSSSAATVRRR